VILKTVKFSINGCFIYSRNYSLLGIILYAVYATANRQVFT